MTRVTFGEDCGKNGVGKHGNSGGRVKRDVYKLTDARNNGEGSQGRERDPFLTDKSYFVNSVVSLNPDRRYRYI